MKKTMVKQLELKSITVKVNTILRIYYKKNFRFSEKIENNACYIIF